MAGKLHRMGLICAAMMLGGCVTSPSLTRGTHPTFFELQAEGSVPAGAVQDMADCLHDGFARSHLTYTNIKPSITRRVDGFRVEAKTNNMVRISVDVMEGGGLQFHRMKHATFADFSGERMAFTTCIQVYGGTVTRPFDAPTK